MVLVVPPLAFVALAGVIINGINLPTGRWLILLVTLWVGALPFAALGLLLGTALDRDTATIVALGFVLALAILGGLFAPIATQPPVVAAIARVLPSYHLGALGWAAIVGRGPDPIDVTVLAGYTAGLSAILTWRRGNETTRTDGWRDRLPDCRVLMLTTFDRPGYLRLALERGATGFLLKDSPASTLADAIRRAKAGLRTVDSALAVAALSEGANPLSDHEREVLVTSVERATVAAIAVELFLSEGTVRNHLSATIQKLGARNRAEAVRIAQEKGWLKRRAADGHDGSKSGGGALP